MTTTRTLGRTTLLLAGLVAPCAGVAGAQGVAVGGRIVIQEKDNKPSRDLGNAVVWLEGAGASGKGGQPGGFDIVISDKIYVPRVVVVPVGSTVRFPNRDPINHNVFSLSDSNSFDLGLYGRGETRSQAFRHGGLVRVFCNVHPRMVAYVLVMPHGLVVQAGADGSFRIAGVAPGRYRLRVWHERVASETTQDIDVGAGGLEALQLSLDARGYRWRQHKNKSGQDYAAGARRERY